MLYVQFALQLTLQGCILQELRYTHAHKMLCSQEIVPFVRILGCYPIAQISSVASPVVEPGAAQEIQEQIAARPPQSGGQALENGTLDSDSLLISAAASSQPLKQVCSSLQNRRPRKIY